MLKPPYTRYRHLHVYHLDAATIPAVNDPDLIGIWMEDETPILFFHKAKDALVAELCATSRCNLIYQADLDYSDWEAGQDIATFTLEGVTVTPVWENQPADLRIDPSVIFGSGFHPSTRLCLETLIRYCRTPEVRPKSMLDLGAGTGLLSLAAAHLGVTDIRAFDNNRLACEVASKNCRLNHFDEVIEVSEIDLRKNPPDTCGVDLVVANLYHTLLTELFGKPSFWQAKLYIIAGFIPSMEQELLAALPANDIIMIERRRSDRWCLWVLAPKAKNSTCCTTTA
ncbi:MAG: 50S ribosomal protein L11 methyltransferase [Proteobacteria bacterium]|nr:50S ribosomal protein L11 methyltransferase [Pseudomonadota bacterium]MBU1737783.1 50S ribosomal protein L11 methyltransferase [Pseudomonadota bacterium]